MLCVQTPDVIHRADEQALFRLDAWDGLYDDEDGEYDVEE